MIDVKDYFCLLIITSVKYRGRFGRVSSSLMFQTSGRMFQLLGRMF